MQHMLSNWFKLAASIFTISIHIFSCEDQAPDLNNSPTEQLNEESEELLTQYVIFDLILNDLEVLTFDALSNLEERDPSGSAFTHIDSYLFFGRGSCAIITNDFDLNLITLDFGNGCIDNKGIYREGSLQVNYDHADNRVGNRVQVDLTSYKFQNQSFRGSFTINRQPNIEFDDAFQIGY